MRDNACQNTSSVSEEDSYNEAAQTLLTISNLAHGTQSKENRSAVKDQAG